MLPTAVRLPCDTNVTGVSLNHHIVRLRSPWGGISSPCGISNVMPLAERGVLKSAILFIVIERGDKTAPQAKSLLYPRWPALAKPLRTRSDIATERLYVPTIDCPSALVRKRYPRRRTTQFPTNMFSREDYPRWVRCRMRPVFLPSSTTYSRGRTKDQDIAWTYENTPSSENLKARISDFVFHLSLCSAQHF